jgi:hypothetical protein
MLTRTHITIALALAAVAWGAVLWIQNVAVTWAHLAPFSTVVAVLVGVGLVIDNWAWRWPVLQGWVFYRPDIRGTWRVTIQSEYVDPTTNARVAPIIAYAGVVQTYSKLQIQIMTPESESCLLANSITSTACGERFEIAVVYSNTPKVELRGVRSERQVGAAIIATHGRSKYKPDSMTAEYWTDRRTVGRMTFEQRVPTVYSRYEDASRAA